MHKTKILALLLAVAMVASMIVPSVSAAADGTCPAHNDAAWTEIAEGTWTGGAIADGHYKLTGNQAITSALIVEGNVCIDLAGCNITASADKDNNYRAFEVTGALTIIDSAEVDGVISGGHMETKPAADVKVYGGNILVAGGKLNLYGGEISGGYMRAPSYMYHVYGGNIGLTEGAELNIYGGAVKDGKIEVPQQATQYHGGGNIYADASTVNIYGGTVSGGDVIARYSSGSKDARKAYGVGGNIAVNGGTFYMEDGLVDDGNLDVRCNASGTSAAGSTAHAHGGNVYCMDSTVTIKGGVISNGTLSGEAIIANAEKSPSLEAQGGNLYIKNCTAEIKGDAQILNGEIVNDNTSARGGNLFVAAGTVTMSENAVLSGGICPTDNARGGNVFVIGTFNFNGGAISDGAAGWGANMMLQSGATINMNGGAVTGGTGGYSVLIQRGTFNMTAGSIADANEKPALAVDGTTDTNGGKAYISGGNIGEVYLNRASLLEVSGGVIGEATLSRTATLELKAGATVTGMWKAAETATVTVAEGVIFQSKNPALNGVEGFEAYLMDKSTGVTTYTVYTKLATALAAAKAGNTVTLMQDVTADEVVVPANVTLNLYGSVLTAGSVTATFEGAQIKDSKLGESGVGKIVSNSVSVAENNAFLPVTMDGAYIFEEVTFAENLTVADNKATYKFYVKSEAAATLIDDAILAGNAISFEVKVTWTNADGEAKYKVFVLDAALLAQLAADWDNKMVILTINDLTGISDLTCTAQVVSNGNTVTA